MRETIKLAKIAGGVTATALVAVGVLGGASAASADTGPVVTGLSVSSGMPGIVVAVNGSGFLGGCLPGAGPSVFFGIVQVTPLSGPTDTQLHFQVPVLSAGFYDVQVQDCNGAVSPAVAADQFTMTLPPRPKISAVSPKTGTVGTTITVTGTSFRLYCTDGRLPSVTFDNPDVFNDEVTLTDGAPQIVSWSDTKLVVQAPVHPAGIVDILTRDCTGRTNIPSTTDEFTYLAPKISTISPTSGTAATLVTIKGTSFFNGCAAGSAPTLLFGGTSLTAGSPGVVSMSATQIVLNAPAHLAGAVQVQVQDCVGDVSPAITYTYTAPKISSISPTTGTIGTTVTVSGSGFLNGCVTGVSAPAVQFGATLYSPGDPAIVSATATSIKVLAPSAPAGKVDIRVFDCLGDETAVVTADKYTYKAPAVTAVSPTSGHVGTVVTVKGSGFLTGCTGGARPSLLVGTTTVPGTDPSVSSVTATAFTLTAPDHATGTVDMRVVDCVGDVTALTTADKFRYL